MKRKKYRLKMHVGTHAWLRYGDVYEGEDVPAESPRLKPAVRLFNPSDPGQSIELKAAWLEEVR